MWSSSLGYSGSLIGEEMQHPLTFKKVSSWKYCRRLLTQCPHCGFLQIQDETHQAAILDKDELSEDSLNKPPVDKYVYFEEGWGRILAKWCIFKMSQAKKKGIWLKTVNVFSENALPECHKSFDFCLLPS